MEDPSSDECPLCFESIDKKTIVSLNCCSHQKIHIECYSKCLPKCPFCRKEQPDILPRIVVVTDWKKVTKSICVSFFASACLTIFVTIHANC
jgi:hypothetical protein